MLANDAAHVLADRPRSSRVCLVATAALRGGVCKGQLEAAARTGQRSAVAGTAQRFSQTGAQSALLACLMHFYSVQVQTPCKVWRAAAVSSEVALVIISCDQSSVLYFAQLCQTTR